MPPDTSAPPAAEPAFDVAAFLADNPSTEADPEPVSEDADAPIADAALGDSENEAESAILASLDGEETAAEETEAEGEEVDPEAPAEDAKGIDVKALETALKSKNPEAFLAALGAAAEDVLGAKAHRALRIAAKDVATARSNLLKASDELKERFGDPAAIRAAATKGDADAVVEGVEKFFGAPWADFIKFVNESFAGKEARLESKAAKAKAEADAKAAKEQAETAVNNERQSKAVAQLKTAIADTVKKTQPSLAAFPGLTDLVFDKLKSGYTKGVNTPAKAIAAVLVDLRAQHAELSKAFAPPAKKVSKTAPPPRETAKRGREMTEDEFIKEFLRENRP